jgi:hypothetical protein
MWHVIIEIMRVTEGQGTEIPKTVYGDAIFTRKPYEITYEVCS